MGEGVSWQVYKLIINEPKYISQSHLIGQLCKLTSVPHSMKERKNREGRFGRDQGKFRG